MEDERKHIGLTDAQMDVSMSTDHALLREGQAFVDREKASSQRHTLRTHWRGALFSLGLSFALVMEGYDGIVGSFYGQPAFQQTFGTLQPDGSYQISANWQTTIGNVQTVGNLVGLLLTGFAQERYGSRKTYIAGMALMFCMIFITVFSNSIGMFMAGSVLSALPWGMFQTLTTAYAAEICPINLRGLLASFVNMAWGIGLVLNSGIGRASLQIDQSNSWAWRLPFCLQWVWPVPLATIAYFAPESPWWLVRHGRLEEAEQSLRRTANPHHYDGQNLGAYIAYMQHADKLAQLESKNDCEYIHPPRALTLQMAGVWAIQVWGGNGVTGLAVQFMEDSGLSVTGAFDVNLTINCMVIIGCFLAWFLLPYFGRRPLYLVSLVVIGACLLIIGCLATRTLNNGSRIAMAALMVFIQLLYSTSIGPLCYAIAGELPNSRLRSQSIVMGRALYCCCGFITGQLGPRFVNQTGWNLGAKSAFFWLGTNILCTTWCFFRLPETGGFSFAELEILFSNKVSTRRFKHVVVHDEAAEVKPQEQFEEKMETKSEDVAATITHLEG